VCSRTIAVLVRDRVDSPQANFIIFSILLVTYVNRAGEKDDITLPVLIAIKFSFEYFPVLKLY